MLLYGTYRGDSAARLLRMWREGGVDKAKPTLTLRPPGWISAQVLSLALAVALVVASPATLAGGTASKPVPCKYEENCDCAVPGITLRWQAAYCMSLEETDDLENDAVQKCLAKPDPDAVSKLAACEQNAHWKTMICRVVRDKKEVEECARDKTFVPRFIEEGPGS